ncbi:MAG: AAA family ATPase [Treponema sp.]|nr:AAA family ATPase [Treponema sp.]
MVCVPVKVKMPFLWGRAVFRKDEWRNINLIVGPNGSGKTLLVEAIAEAFAASGYAVKFFRADEREDREALDIVQGNEPVRQKIQAVLSSMFGKTIVFKQGDGGSYVPVVVNRAWNVEYNLEEVECHGLREIITLLSALYANTGNSCLIFDEPELHLHPQFQQFFAEELRRVSQRHPTRMYFVVTHSPFFIDLRFPEDFLGVLVCHTNREPTHIESLGRRDEDLLGRFLPRFNSYHKQFFFSDNQIFVEGYTDQQLFASLLPYVQTERGVAGTGIIDVGGKDELGVFCKVCSLLGTNSRIITDLDSLFGGKLRDVFCADARAAQWLERQGEKQRPFYESIFTVRELGAKITLEKLIFRLERYLAVIGRALCDVQGPVGYEGEFGGLQEPGREPGPLEDELALLVEKLDSLDQKHSRAENVDTFKTVVLQGVMAEGELQGQLARHLPESVAVSLPLVRNLFNLILAASAAAGVYILPQGCIEHYYTQSSVRYMPVAGKDRLFHMERKHLLLADPDTVRREYAPLLSILEAACAR